MLRRVPLTRKTELKRKTQLKRTNMPRTSKTKQRKQAEAKHFYEDCCGLRFSELRSRLPNDPHDWEPVRIVTRPTAMTIIHDLFGFCFLCETWYSCQGRIEAHHIVSGPRRSHELTNLILLCPEHHDAVQGQEGQLQRVLLAKWKHDREHTSWRRLTLLRGRWWDFDSLD